MHRRSVGLALVLGLLLVGLVILAPTELAHASDGYWERLPRNIAIALGNGPGTDEIIAALKLRAHDPSALIREHSQWALAQHLP